MSKKITQEEFISRIKEIYGDSYILDDALYVNNCTHVELVCRKHGKFKALPMHLFKGHGCKKCTYEFITSTFEEFVEKAKRVHANKYTYVDYVNARTPCKIICPVHGEFEQKPSSHLSGCGCPKCANRRLTNEEIIEKFKKVHGDKYDYSKVDFQHRDENGKICIICPKHGEFWQKPSSHLFGYGCPNCNKDTTETFIEKARKTHGGKYDYSKVEYVNSYTKVCIVCPKHGKFWQKPNDHLNGCGCPICNESNLEKEIRELLVNEKIEFVQSANKNTLEWLGRQHLDFYLPKHKIGIECQGEQHYVPVSFSSDKSLLTKLDNFKRITNRDIRKKSLCKENGIRLLYFTHYDGTVEDNVETFKENEKLLKAINSK